MSEYPDIVPPVVTSIPEGEQFRPYKRNEQLARGWAMPGTKGLEHRIGGLEKDSRCGAVSHDPDNHAEMVALRAAKVAKVADTLPTQEVMGEAQGDLLVIGWGGTRGHLQSAVEELQAEGHKVSLCHFNYINPLPNGVAEILAGFKKVVVCELNCGQFAGYLLQNFQNVCFEQYNKVMGLPFTVRELKEHFVSLLK